MAFRIMCLQYLREIFQNGSQGMLKTLGGMVLGGARMMLLMSFLAQFFCFFRLMRAKYLQAGAHLYRIHDRTACAGPP